MEIAGSQVVDSETEKMLLETDSDTEDIIFKPEETQPKVKSSGSKAC